MLDTLSLATIEAAAERIAPYVLRTPTLVHEEAHGTLYLKAESLQPIGAFKIRGAFSMMTTLGGAPGVVAHSSGNHAQAVARAAKVLGIPAVIVMPSDAPPMKLERTKADGAEVIIVSPDSDEREQRAAAIAEERGYVPVPPFDHPLVAAGQGTAALELLADAPALDRFYAPVSGGGLMAGCATVFAAKSPGCEIVGVEPEDADDTKQSLAAGERKKVAPPQTIADGLRVRTPGRGTFEVIKKHVARVELVTDDELLDSMRFAAVRLRLVLEPSGAASLAVARRELREHGGHAGVLLSGGNADPAVFARCLSAPDPTRR
ncbi:MAG: threonine/serine dehydratase [Deltaproteobacteria bacterium]|jgi:threonine dehydratase